MDKKQVTDKAEILGNAYLYRSLSRVLIPNRKDSEPKSKWEETIDILKNKRFFFTKATNFDDPYDCQIPYEIPDEIYEDLIIQTGQARVGKFPTDEIKADMVKARAQLATAEGKRQMTDSIHKMVLDEFSVRSFCGIRGATETNVLMWVNHADNKRGLCFVFENMRGLRAVDYVGDLFPVNPCSDVYEERRKSIFRKAKYWSYEHELRIISTRRDKGFPFLPFDSKQLVMVQFGTEALQTDIDEIIKILIDSKYNEVELVKMKLSRTHYTFEYHTFGVVRNEKFEATDG